MVDWFVTFGFRVSHQFGDDLQFEAMFFESCLIQHDPHLIARQPRVAIINPHLQGLSQVGICVCVYVKTKMKLESNYHKNGNNVKEDLVGHVTVKLRLKKVKPHSEDKNHLYHAKQLTCGIPQRKQNDEYHRHVQSHHQGFVWKRLSQLNDLL